MNHDEEELEHLNNQSKSHRVSKKVALLIGNGGREHAWALALKESKVDIITWAPVLNPGIEDIAIASIKAPIKKDQGLLEEWTKRIDIAIIGPEAPLVDGMSDWLGSLGIFVFSPSQKNAQLEGSKSYMRTLLKKHNVQGNIGYWECTTMNQISEVLRKSLKVAIKPDGLTGGKGVRVHGDHFTTFQEAEEYCKELLKKDGSLVLEEKLEGIEFSLMGLAYGTKIVFLPLVKDYKRAFENDTGPNTGSMGSVSFPNHDLPYLSQANVEQAKNIVVDVLQALKAENGDYIGAIYGQFMETATGPKIIEFNARLGDPEAINTLALLDRPLIEIIEELRSGKSPNVQFRHEATCVVYLVPEGYPTNPEAGAKVSFPDQIIPNIRFASITRAGDKYEITRSRSATVIGYGKTLEESIKNAYGQLPDSIEGLRYRKDIGKEFLN